MSFVPCLSNLQYVDASFILWAYCIIDSFESYLVHMNLVLSKTTSIIILITYFSFLYLLSRNKLILKSLSGT